MSIVSVFRRCAALVLLSAALAVTGCTSSSHGPGSSMMGGSGYNHSGLSCTAPNSLPGAIVTVTLSDMGMTQMATGTAPLGSHMRLLAAPTTVPAGSISIVASNRGWRTHELVILPLHDGSLAGQRVPASDGKVAEAGSVGEASASCAGGKGTGVTAKSDSWTTITLPPGRYEFLCNLPNHYADGMWQELTVA